MREEVNTIDSSDLFLDVFVTNHFNNYGGLLTLEHEDATSYSQVGLEMAGMVVMVLLLAGGVRVCGPAALASEADDQVEVHKVR